MFTKGLLIAVFTLFTANAVTFRQIDTEPTAYVYTDASIENGIMYQLNDAICAVAYLGNGNYKLDTIS